MKYLLAVYSLSPLLFATAVQGQTVKDEPKTPMSQTVVNTQSEPVTAGKFKPTWQSLQQYRVPRWYQDAKFGIWAHWGPQCEPEAGDWYAREMYDQGSGQYQSHVAHYGHPSQFGFKDVIHQWKAEHWNPQALMALYKRAGAQYFVALANHHDNFDNWNSKYQPSWNSTKIGPHKDIIGGWAQAARAQGLRFGVSVHAAHAWTWYELAQGADRSGPLTGVPYDGKLTKAQGAGQWWEGLDPQELYAQNHAPSVDFMDAGKINAQWDWGKGASIPDAAYCEKFYNRTVDLLNRYQPDLVYFDDTVLPLYPISDAGLKIAAHFYNSNIQHHNGKLEAVLTGKILDEAQRKTMVWDIERGQANEIEPYVWQTDTCIGSWHYDRALYERNGYKSARTVIQTLCDVVSKNGNLLLSVPVRGDGTIDEKETAVVQGIASWMDTNKESIFGTRPWKVFGEGPASSGTALSAQGFNEGRGKPFTAQDFRFTTKGDTLYAIALGWPEDGKWTIKTLSTTQNLKGAIRDVQLLGAPKVEWKRDQTGLSVTVPRQKHSENAWVLKIKGLNLTASQPVMVTSQAATLIQPDKNGALLLSATAAALHGTLRTESQGDTTNIGFWDNASDWASWTVKVPRPAVYNLTARVATTSDGSEFVIGTDGQEFKSRVPNTGAWNAYQDILVGKITFQKAGLNTVTLRPRDSSHWKAINLASLRLEKTP